MWSFKKVQISMKQKVTGKIITFKFLYTKKSRLKHTTYKANLSLKWKKVLINCRVNPKLKVAHKKHAMKTSYIIITT